MREYYQLSEKELRKQLNGSQLPLTNEQVKEHQQKYGMNQIQEGKKKTVPVIFLEQYKDFLVLILIVSAIVSGFLGDWESAIVILVVITINAVLGTVQTIKAEQSLESLKKLSSPKAKVLRDGNMIEIPSEELTVGDEIALFAGDFVPADGRIIDCSRFTVDESTLTGESVPVEKNAETIEENAALGDRTNMVYSGSFVTDGRASCLVTNVGMGTEIGKISALLKTASDKKTPLQKNLDQFGRKLSVLILVFCGLLFGIQILWGGNAADAFMFAVALAVAAIPEALSSIVTIVLSFGTRKMASENAIVRKLQAVEGLGSVSVICSDKTGTLTQNKMTVRECYVDGTCVEAEEMDPQNASHQALMLSGILCNDAVRENEQEIGDPTETALLHLAANSGMDVSVLRSRFPRISENPFDSDRKLMSTLNVMEENPVLFVKGAPEILLKKITGIRENGQIRKADVEDIQKILEQNRQFSKRGLRVLGFACKELQISREVTPGDETDLIFLGLTAIIDPPRKEAKAAVEKCKRAGIRPVMITGDHKITAAAIAEQIGILDEASGVCEGAELDHMSDEELEDFVEGISVYARVSPEHKIRIVRAWQAKGKSVAMTGDGVNDAPALKQADIGVAMGITGSEVSKDAASIVLTDDNFATILTAVENGRNIYQNIKKAIQFLLSGNFGAILAVLFASVAGYPLPFEPVHLLFINLLTDSLPAIALGLEPHNGKVMDEKPRPSDESILTRDFLMKVGIEGLVVGFVSMSAFLFGSGSGSILLGKTMAFGTLCMSRLVHGFNCKNERPVLFTKQFWNNRYLIGAFMAGMVLITAVLMIPQLAGVFRVQTLTFLQLLIVCLMALLHLVIIQLLKKIRIVDSKKNR